MRDVQLFFPRLDGLFVPNWQELVGLGRRGYTKVTIALFRSVSLKFTWVSVVQLATSISIN